MKFFFLNDSEGQQNISKESFQEKRKKKNRQTRIKQVKPFKKKEKKKNAGISKVPLFIHIVSRNDI